MNPLPACAVNHPSGNEQGRYWSAARDFGQGMLPVFLPLRELDKLNEGLDAFIQDQLANPHLKTPVGFGERLLGRGNLLFLLDGLDEVANLAHREKVAGWIVDALRAKLHEK